MLIKRAACASPGAASAAHPDTARPHSTPPCRPTVSLHGRDPGRRHTRLPEHSGQGGPASQQPLLLPFRLSAGIQARAGPAEPSGSPGDHWFPCRQEGREWGVGPARGEDTQGPGAPIRMSWALHPPQGLRVSSVYEHLCAPSSPHTGDDARDTA